MIKPPQGTTEINVPSTYGTRDLNQPCLNLQVQYVHIDASSLCVHACKGRISKTGSESSWYKHKQDRSLNNRYPETQLSPMQIAVAHSTLDYKSNIHFSFRKKALGV